MEIKKPYSSKKFAMLFNKNNDFIMFKDMIESDQIVSYAQPIIDLFSGRIKGFEMLARGPEPYFSPAVLFQKASDYNLQWELEYVCLSAALKRIAELCLIYPKCDFFINISPEIFSSPRFESDFILNKVEKYNIDPKTIVIEITETAIVEDQKRFEERIKAYVGQGFRIALDDFGSGYSGLITLIASNPHILKIDKTIVRDIDKNNYKQNLVRSLCEFASTVGSSTLAEGVETEAELTTAFRFGVRFAQGFYFAKPEKDPKPIDKPKQIFLNSLIKKYSKKTSAIDISIYKLILRPKVFKSETVICSEIEKYFQNNPKTDHIILTDKNNYPAGLLTREKFFSQILGFYEYSVFRNKFAISVAQKKMLIVKEDVDLRILGNLTMNRENSNLYDPVIVTDSMGVFLGTITMKDIILKAFDTEVKFATSTNSVTNLPGNTVINMWMEQILKNETFSIAYIDLDRFKEFNDCYGFTAGDELLKFTSDILQKQICEYNNNLKLGHIGGDDFVILSETIPENEFYSDICTLFDKEKLSFFTEKDANKGTYLYQNRQGACEEIPLITLSIAVITSENFLCPVHSGKLSQCISLLKAKIKDSNQISQRSGFLKERRVYKEFS